jgi:hypothetical protein
MAGRAARVASVMVAVTVACPSVLFHKMIRSTAANSGL